MDAETHGWADGWMDSQRIPEGKAGLGEGALSPGSHLPAEVHLVQQLDPQQDADLVESLDTFRCFSRSRFIREFSIRPSTRWFWKAWEYWDRPMSLSFRPWPPSDGPGPRALDRLVRRDTAGERDGWGKVAETETGRNGAEMTRERSKIMG